MHPSCPVDVAPSARTRVAVRPGENMPNAPPRPRSVLEQKITARQRPRTINISTTTPRRITSLARAGAVAPRRPAVTPALLGTPSRGSPRLEVTLHRRPREEKTKIREGRGVVRFTGGTSALVPLNQVAGVELVKSETPPNVAAVKLSSCCVMT